MTRALRRRTRWPPTRRCTPPTRTARARRTASSRCSTTTTPSTRSPRGRGRCSPPARRDADVLHLHHLTPLNEAAARVAPHVPIVGHLHGTELLMLEAIEDDPHRWPHGPAWAERLRGWAAACERLIVLSETQVERAERLLGIDPERCVLIPNGFDPDLFGPRQLDHARSGAGCWSTSRAAGRRTRSRDPALRGRSTRSTHGDAGAALRRPLHRGQAHPAADRGLRARPPGLQPPRAARARRRLPRRVGGRAPARRDRAASARRTSSSPAGTTTTSCRTSSPPTDVIVLPERARAVRPGARRGDGLRAAGDRRRRHGPADIVDHGETGWLVEPDDVDGLANALVEAVNRPQERRRRGADGRRGRRRALRLAGAGPQVADAVRRGRAVLTQRSLRTNAAQTR